MKTFWLSTFIINFNSNLKLNKYKYYIALFAVITFNSFLSFENITFDLYFNNLYEEFANYFKTKDLNSFTNPNTTFPMWGYSLFHLFGKSVILNLVVQQLFTFINLIILDIVIRKHKLIYNIDLFRITILLSSTWFLFHTQMWPKSPASNLLLLGIILLIDYCKTKKYRILVLSAICFGILHNFRSEYFYLSILIMLFLLIYDKKINDYIKTSSFLLIQLMFLIPWMIFTFNQIGKPLINSTNSGHVFFIGLGQLPNNIWGIKPFDKDPLKQELLEKKFQKNYDTIPYSSWNSIEENNYLKKEFYNFVSNQPKEWIKKNFYAIRLLILDPFYVGNVGNFQQNKISNIKEIRNLEALFYNFKFREMFDLIYETKWNINAKEIIQLLVTVYTKLFGIMIFVAFLISTLIASYKLLQKKIEFSRIEILLLIIIIYQIAISVLAFHMPVYNSSIYIIYVIVLYLLFQKNLSIKQ